MKPNYYIVVYKMDGERYVEIERVYTYGKYTLVHLKGIHKFFSDKTSRLCRVRMYNYTTDKLIKEFK